MGASRRPLAVLCGTMGKLPYGGLSLIFVHHAIGLQDLGYDVHYLEVLNGSEQCYNPETDTSSDNPTYAVRYLETVLPAFGIDPDRVSFIDKTATCHGSGWPKLCDALDRADFLLTLAHPTWIDEMERCGQRAFVDIDPFFTQTAMLSGDAGAAAIPSRYSVLFTYGTRIGRPDCPIPSAGCRWIPTRPVVATRLWTPRPPRPDAPVTTVAHWAAGGEITWDGRTYGHKDREFERLIDLPSRLERPIVLALGGARRHRFAAHGWRFVDPLAATARLDDYQAFIDGSYAELGVAKEAYVASRSGWFADRSASYLAAGRPVIHHDTGFTDWLEPGRGVFSFRDADDVVEAIGALEARYTFHAEAARRIAESEFEASTVIRRMLDDAGFRQ